MNYYQQPEREFNETVVQINRISKKTKGGNQIRFGAVIVLGDKKGKVGMGISKATDVRNAIRKAIEDAKKNMITITMKGTTIPYSVISKMGASKVLLKPAPPGSGIIAGGPMRVVLESSGLRDVVGKTLGGSSKIGSVRATIQALQMTSKLKDKKDYQRDQKSNKKEEKKNV
ncbi:MAG: 30S ribosomal protein S5 [Candidatus Woesebacteria bacterium GW2011_GWA1_33_30]|uniref:Small ribosomal subunit protein uS5 n=1 Tax=Candidatus Woesebacteria bacterium GW2011_GWA2_33_28 TaxID=1618561 RepID=A0A0F9ZTT0_9BACT|nr:MAG: 30S ribosomal protein S5 [Candidatus Woesebacteria bacterium GW2011_GWA2_33_28]KKP48580.1 MAG: 30S ribosomal protein S5 [Candidatus Woesebacteria bacterium GW2011_GWA1_33_30]KKP49719.1 MAG: 30S ribosomal protein S5 [Microgenomates group bacterium GW2011_GWC1_33_32]KKP52336.1 MAG: 30S ribosomal protein S5 [Candidatus Woesebacteria bacterium GW2011_GWB1_33_38]KKP55904.1 MAG: 30S ribosomal protein S5 [Microgenomates group bacterium GW2011_GWD1_33_9]